ncbi:hypothetical protein ES703_85468 [subsurface metagenome]
MILSQYSSFFSTGGLKGGFPIIRSNFSLVSIKSKKSCATIFSLKSMSFSSVNSSHAFLGSSISHNATVKLKIANLTASGSRSTPKICFPRMDFSFLMVGGGISPFFSYCSFCHHCTIRLKAVTRNIPDPQLTSIILILSFGLAMGIHSSTMKLTRCAGVYVMSFLLGINSS